MSSTKNDKHGRYDDDEKEGKKGKEPVAKRDPRDGDVDLSGLRADLLPPISGGLPGKAISVEPQAITPGTWPSPIDGWRAAVHNVPVTVVNPAYGDEKLPYPTGTPIAPGSKFWLTNGYYKSAVPT